MEVKASPPREFLDKKLREEASMKEENEREREIKIINIIDYNNKNLRNIS